MKNIDCPYCDHGQNIDHDDGYGHEEDRLHQQECESCLKIFTFRTSIIYHYESFRAKCLNGGEHKFVPSITYPNCLTKMGCETCEETRGLTDKERKKLKIQTVEEYLKELEDEE